MSANCGIALVGIDQGLQQVNELVRTHSGVHCSARHKYLATVTQFCSELDAYLSTAAAAADLVPQEPAAVAAVREKLAVATAGGLALPGRRDTVQPLVSGAAEILGLGSRLQLSDFVTLIDAIAAQVNHADVPGGIWSRQVDMLDASFFAVSSFRAIALLAIDPI